MPPTGKPNRPVVLTDARDIKALTHPARLAVIDEFFSGRELTATECADIAGVTPSAMSYHLRALEKAGIIERAGSSDDGRERPWRATGASLEISPESVAGARLLSTLLANDVLARMNAELIDWITRSQAEAKLWRDTGGVISSRLWLTLDELRELEATVRAFVDSRRGRTADERPPGSRRVRVGVLAFPLDVEPERPARPVRPARSRGGST